MKSASTTLGMAAVVMLSICWFVLLVPAQAEIVSGSGEWQSNSGDAMRGTWTITCERSGTELKGSISLTGSLLFSGSEINGTFEGDQLMVGTVADGQNQVSFTGTVTDDRISGEWECPAINDSGTWSGTLHIAPEQ